MNTTKEKLLAFLRSDIALLMGIAALKLLIHILTSGGYGYFRDEFYYIAASKRLAFGYVDFPPFIALITALVRLTLGTSRLAIRLLPAVAGALIVLFTGLMARRLGASRNGQAVAALAALFAPIFLGANSILTMDSFDQLAWVLASYVLIGIFQNDRPKDWLWFGLIAGIGLTIKVTFLYFGLAVVIGLALTPWRKYFRSKWLWLGGGIALVFLLPYIAWNAANGFPTLEFWRNYGSKVYPDTALQFVLQQILLVHPITVGLWVAGLAYTFSKDGQRYRPLGWAYLVMLVVFILQGVKNYFLAPAYPMLLALGVTAFERIIPRKSLLHWLYPSWPVLVVFGLLLVPYTVAVLPVGTLVKALKTGVGSSAQTERLDSGVLPQYFADRFGWTELTQKVVQAYQSLPPADQAQACIFTDNYGEAGALEFFGRPYRLPRVTSGHNSYFLWGPGDCSGQVMIFVTSAQTLPQLQRDFSSVIQLGPLDCRYCMPYEAETEIFVTHGFSGSIQALWKGVKHYN